jgi:hypothetical protein
MGQGDNRVKQKSVQRVEQVKRGMAAHETALSDQTEHGASKIFWRSLLD